MPVKSDRYPLLAIDSSSRKTWVGIKKGPNQLSFCTSEEDPSKSVFILLEQELRRSELDLKGIASIAYCEGPGSMLGVRAAVMAIRTWAGIGIPATKELSTFTSLELGRIIIDENCSTPKNSLIVTDARRNAWNSLDSSKESGKGIELVDNEILEAETRPIVTFSNFVQWTKTSATLIEFSYTPEIAFADERYIEALRPVPEAAPLNLRESDYKKWIPKIHANPQT